MEDDWHHCPRKGGFKIKLTCIALNRYGGRGGGKTATCSVVRDEGKATVEIPKREWSYPVQRDL